MASFDKLADYDLDHIKLLTDYAYDDALVGITEDNRAIYDYDLMVRWLVKEEGTRIPFQAELRRAKPCGQKEA